MTSDRRTGLRWLYGFVNRYRRGIAQLLLLSLATTSLVIAQPWVTKLIIDDGLIARDFDRLWQMSVLGLALGITATLLSGFSRLAHTHLSGKILFALREDVYGHLLHLPTPFFMHQRAGDISSRIDRDVAEIQRFAVDTLFSSLSAVVGLIGAAGMMLYLSWQLSLVLLLLVPLELAYLAVMRPKVEQRNRHFRERSADISAYFAEKIPAIKTIQAARAQRQELSLLGALNTHLLTSLLGLQRIEFATSAVPTILVSIARASVFLIGGYQVIEGRMQVGSLIAFTAYVGMAIGPVQSLLGLYLAWQRLTVSLDRVSYLREQPLDIREERGKDLPAELDGTLTVTGLQFRYQTAQPLLEDVTFSAPPGTKIGIIGPSGEGKSTLLDLLSGFQTPDSGQIFLGGIDQGATRPSSWRQAFALATQDTVIFRDSLRNNLLYGTPVADDATLHAVIDAAGLTPLLNKLPDGLDSPISERGTSLSGGERQRIGVARVMLKKPRILILDEPISAADPETGRAVIDAVDHFFADTTRIVVSHRIEAVVNSDQCFSLHNGVLEAIEPATLVS